MENKKGILPILGIITALGATAAVIVLIILATTGFLTFYFIIKNILLLIAGVIVVFGFIYGVAKAENKLLTIVVISMIGLVFVGLHYSGIIQEGILGEKESISFFYSKEFGLIKNEVVKKPIFQIEEQAFFSEMFGKVDESTTINSYADLLKDCINFVPKKWIIEITAEGIMSIGPLVTIDLTSQVKSLCGVGGLIKTSFTPTKAGKYSADDYYTYFEKFSGTTKTHRYAASNIYTATAKEADVCKKTPYFGDWVFIKYVENGYEDERIFYYVAPNCEYIKQHTEGRTICKEGYVIKGTNNKVGYSGMSCVKIEREEEVINECDDNVEERCDDGSKVIIKECVKGELKDTGKLCLEVEEGEKEEEEEEEEEEEKEFGIFWTKYKYHIIFSILGVLLFIIIIILATRRR